MSWCVRLVFLSSLVDVSVSFLDKQAADPPKSPVAASNVDLIPLDVPRQEVEKPVEGSTVVAWEILGCHFALVVSSFFCTRVLFVVLSSTFVLILLCWQSLANQVAEQAEFLRRTSEDIQLTADQSLQLERTAALERSSQE